LPRLTKLALALWLTSLAGSAFADLAFVTNQNSSDVSVIDVELGREVRRIAVPGQPAGIAVAQKLDAVFVVSPETKTVSRFGKDAEAVEAVVTLDGGPIGIAVDEARGRVFVSDWYNARIWVIDAANFEVVGELATGSAPAGLVLTERWLVSADRDADQLSVFDAETLALHGRVTVGERPFGVSAGPQGRVFTADVGSNTVSVVDPASLELTSTIPVGARPYGIAFAGDHGFVTNQYADSLSVFNLSTLDVVDTIDVGEYPEGIDVTSGGDHILVACWFSNSVTVIDPTTREVVGEIETGDGPRAFGQFVWED